jgi:hypothetical protein
MASNGPHLSPERIRESACKNLILEPEEFVHIQNCDKCSDAWWKLRQEAKRKKQNPDDTKKSA